MAGKRGRGRPRREVNPARDEQLLEEQQGAPDLDLAASDNYEADAFLEGLSEQLQVDLDNQPEASPPRHDPQSGSSDKVDDDTGEESDVDVSVKPLVTYGRKNVTSDSDSEEMRSSPAPQGKKPRQAPPPPRAPSERIASLAGKTKSPVPPVTKKTAGKKTNRAPPTPGTPRAKKRARADTLQNFHAKVPSVTLAAAEAAVLADPQQRARRVSFNSEVQMVSPPARGEPSFDIEFPTPAQSSPRGPRSATNNAEFQRLVDSEVAKRMAAWSSQGEFGLSFRAPTQLPGVTHGVFDARLAVWPSARAGRELSALCAPHLRWASPHDVFDAGALHD
ncbi:hypothetical protein C8F04DRAFT_1280933, partial [Mycena alexandri]